MIKWKLHNSWTHLYMPTHWWCINKQSAVEITYCRAPRATTSWHLIGLSQLNNGPVFQNGSLCLSLPGRSSRDAVALQHSKATVHDHQWRRPIVPTQWRLVCKSRSKNSIDMFLFPNLPLHAKLTNEHVGMNFSLCLQKNMTLTSPTNVTVTAPFCINQSQDPKRRRLPSMWPFAVSFSSLQLDCHDDALAHYKKQLILVDRNCTNTDFVLDSVEALHSCTLRLVSHKDATNTLTDCLSNTANMPNAAPPPQG